MSTVQFHFLLWWKKKTLECCTLLVVIQIWITYHQKLVASNKHLRIYLDEKSIHLMVNSIQAVLCIAHYPCRFSVYIARISEASSSTCPPPVYSLLLNLSASWLLKTELLSLETPTSCYQNQSFKIYPWIKTFKSSHMHFFY